MLEELFEREDSDIETPNAWHVNPWNFELNDDHPTTLKIKEFEDYFEEADEDE